jgi:uncharacterized protein (DUF58 family)
MATILTITVTAIMAILGLLMELISIACFGYLLIAAFGYLLVSNTALLILRKSSRKTLTTTRDGELVIKEKREVFEVR